MNAAVLCVLSPQPLPEPREPWHRRAGEERHGRHRALAAPHSAAVPGVHQPTPQRSTQGRDGETHRERERSWTHVSFIHRTVLNYGEHERRGPGPSLRTGGPHSATDAALSAAHSAAVPGAGPDSPGERCTRLPSRRSISSSFWLALYNLQSSPGALMTCSTLHSQPRRLHTRYCSKPFVSLWNHRLLLTAYEIVSGRIPAHLSKHRRPGVPGGF